MAESLTDPISASEPTRDSFAPRIIAAVFIILFLNIWRSTVFYPGPWGLQAIKVQHATIAILELLICVKLAPATRKSTLGRALFLPACAYAALVTFSSLKGRHGLDFLAWIQPIEVWLNIWTFVIFLPNGLVKRDYFTIIRWMTVFFAVSAALNLFLAAAHQETLLGTPLLHHVDHRGGSWAAQGIYLHRNNIGSFLCFFPALICALNWTKRHSTWRRLGLAAAFLLVSLNLILSFSRSSQLVALCSFLGPLSISVLGRMRRHYSKLVVWTSALALIVLVTATLFFCASRMPLLFHLQGRDAYWQEIFEKARERPWFGFGLLGVYTQSGETPHNAYLAQLAFYGMVGLTAFSWLFVSIARLIRYNVAPVFKSSPPAQLIVFLLIGVAAQGMVEYIITYPLFFANAFFLFLLGFARSPSIGAMAE